MPEHWVGCEMKLRLSEGSIQRRKIVELPLFDKEHKIVRGLDRTISQAASDISLLP